MKMIFREQVPKQLCEEKRKVALYGFWFQVFMTTKQHKLIKPYVSIFSRTSWRVNGFALRDSLHLIFGAHVY